MSSVTASRPRLGTIAHVTTVHAWDDNRIYRKECRSLARAGYRVVLIATAAPAGMQDGVECIPLPRRGGRFRRMLFGPLDTARALRLAAADLYHLHDPELLPLGFLLALTGHRVVFDAHEDLAAQIMSKLYLPPLLRPLLATGARVLQRVAGRLSSRIVAATPAIAAGYPADKTCLVQNFPLPDELSPVAGPPYLERPARIAYVGGLTAVRGVVEMVRAIGLIGEVPGCALTMAGRFEPGLEERCRELAGWKRVNAVGWQSRPEVAALLGQSRLGLVLYHPEPNHIEAQPNKLFEYMAAGIPVLASDFPLWRDLLTRYQCGLVVDPLDPIAIAGAIQWLLDHPDQARQMGENGRRAVLERFNWEAEATTLLRCYLQL
ncbi:MAG: glycosyltransferase [Gemmatimonadota bacterium]